MPLDVAQCLSLGSPSAVEIGPRYGAPMLLPLPTQRRLAVRLRRRREPQPGRPAVTLGIKGVITAMSTAETPTVVLGLEHRRRP